MRTCAAPGGGCAADRFGGVADEFAIAALPVRIRRGSDAGGDATHFNGIADAFTYSWGTTNRPPEITELADALGNDAFYIHKYVQETAEYVPTYGVSKGAMGVIVDRSGNAFDQAVFLAEMLAEARTARPWAIGAARIKVGYVTLTPAQATQWVGVSGDEQIREIFRSGGVPIELSGGNYRIGHAWVEVDLDYGTGNAANGTYVLDPALKSVTRTAPIGMNFAGYIAPGANIEATLDSYSAGIESVIASPGVVQLSPEQILGEEVIVPADFWQRRIGNTTACGAATSTNCLLRNATRSEQFSFSDNNVAGVAARLPDEFRTRVRVCFAHATGTALQQPQACGAATKIDYSFFADEIYGRRLGIEPNMTSASFPGTSWSPKLILDGATIATLNVSTAETNRTGALRLEVLHPYPGADPATPAEAGSLGDAAHDFGVDATTSIAILTAFGDTSAGLMTKLGAERSNFFDPLIPGTNNVTSGQTAKTTMGGRWLAQTTRMARFHESVNQALTIQHHWAGAVFSRWGDFENGKPRLEAVRISVGGMASEVMLDGSTGTTRTANRQAAEMTYAAAANTLEGSVGEQSFDTPLSSSVARAWGSRPPVGLSCLGGSPPPYFLVTPQNVGSIQPQVCTITASSLGNPTFWGTITRVIGAEYAQAGYRVIASNILQNGPFPVADEGESGLPIGPPRGTLSQRGEAYVAYRQDANSSDIAFVLTDRDGQSGVTLKGGGGGASDQRQTLLEGQKILRDEFQDRSVFNGIDVRTGSFTYTAAPDIALAEDVPFPLTVQRQFRPDDTHCVNCPYGWTHNWDIELMVFSDGLEAMGARTHQQMHSTIAALRAAYLIYKDATRSEIDRQVHGARVLDWWRERFILNVMAYRQGHAQTLYARRGRNRFEAPPGSPNELVFDEDDNTHYDDTGGYLTEIYHRAWSFGASKFTRRTTSGDVQRFARASSSARGFFDIPGAINGAQRVRTGRYRIFSWRFPLNDDPYGTGAPLEINFTYWKDEPEGNEYFDNALKRVMLSFPGHLTYHTLCFAKDFGLQAASGTHDTDCSERQTLASQDSWLSLSASNQGPRLRLNSFRSPAGYTERYDYEVPAANARPSPFWRLKRVFPAQSGTATPEFPSITLVYNRLGQVREAHDAYSALVCTTCAPEAQRGPVTFYSGGRAYAASVQPSVMDVRLWFDHRDRLVQQRVRVDANTATPVWHISTMTYDSRDRLKTRTLPDGQRVEFDYNERNLPTQARRYPRPGSPEVGQVFTVDAAYHSRWDVITSLTDAGSKQGSGVVRNTTTYDYGAANQWQKLNSVTLPAAYNADTGTTVTSRWSFSYDNYRRLMTQTDPRSIVSTFVYTLIGDNRLQSTKQQRGAAWGGGEVVTTFERNQWGAVTHADQPGPGYSDASYDDDGRTLTTSGPLNTFARTTYDTLGRAKEGHARVTRHDGVLREQCTYQEFSRTGKTTLAGRARQVAPSTECGTPADFSLSSFDHADRPTIVTDPEGRKIRFTYDLGGRVIREEREASAGVFQTWKTIEYEPNSNNILRITDGEQRQTIYEYNGFGRLAKATYPDQTFDYFGYDPNGNLTVHWTRAGQRIDMWYDARNRLVWREQTSGPEGPIYAKARTTSFDYDSVGNLRVAYARETGVMCHAGVAYEFDGLNRVRREHQGWGREAPFRECWDDWKTVHYGYQDPQGNDRSRPTSITWPDGFAVYYDLDDLDRVTRIRLCSSGGPGCTGATLVDYEYDELGRRKRSRTAGGQGVLTKYRWEDDGDLAAIAHDAMNDTNGDVVFAASFTRAGEPQTEDITNTAYVWQTATTATATVNALNQFPSWQISGQGAETLLFDANGNLRSWRGRTLVHDPANQLRSVTASGLTATYEYDAKGRRVRKTVNGVTTFFLYAGDAEIGEYNISNAPIRRFIPGPTASETVAMIDGATNAITYLHTDRTGSMVGTSDSQGNVTNAYRISEWGEVLTGQLSGPPFRFIGARYDQETGLYYMRARYYSPEIGRFIETDPAGYGQSTNLYGYGGNSPLVLADPSGEWSVEAALIAAAIAAVVSTVVQAEVNGGDYSQVDYQQVAFSAAQAFALSAISQALFPAAEAEAAAEVAGEAATTGEAATQVATEAGAGSTAATSGGDAATALKAKFDPLQQGRGGCDPNCRFVLRKGGRAGQLQIRVNRGIEVRYTAPVGTDVSVGPFRVPVHPEAVGRITGTVRLTGVDSLGNARTGVRVLSRTFVASRQTATQFIHTGEGIATLHLSGETTAPILMQIAPK